MTRPRLLDLFCGAGGAAMGYHRAGFEVVGVDIDEQPNYPFEFHQADAMAILTYEPLYQILEPFDFDAIHASPPCQHYARVTRWRGRAEDHPALLDAVVERLRFIGLPWVVENVPEAIPRPDLVLCGSQFGLRVRRHRHFLIGRYSFALVPPCSHGELLPFMHKGERAYADAMGCDWMTNIEAREAIPPAYTEYIGRRLLAAAPPSADPPPADFAGVHHTADGRQRATTTVDGGGLL